MSDRKLVPSSYKRLVTDIATLYEGARKALVEAYWKIGQRIVQVEQQGAVKAAYGTSLLSKLSGDLTKQCGPGFSESNLRRMRQFYAAHPKQPPAVELEWSYYTELLPIEDKAVRERLIQKTLRENLDTKTIRRLVQAELVREQVEENRAAAPEEKAPVELLMPPKDLTLRTYKKGEIPSGTATDPTGAITLKGCKTPENIVDCGFYVYRTVTKAELKTVTVTEKPSYAYQASVERVIDGDTLWAVIDIGFNTQVREKLRLRGLDCPELSSPEGEAAKRFVAKLLPPGTAILLKTTRSDDKYGRYVADVFFNDKEGKQVYLNNTLLEQGLAVRMGD